MSKLNRLLFGDRRDPRRVLAEGFGVAVPVSGSPPRDAMAWGQQTLDAAQVSASKDPVVAISVLRREKKLGLRTSKYLVDHLKNVH